MKKVLVVFFVFFYFMLLASDFTFANGELQPSYIMQERINNTLRWRTMFLWDCANHKHRFATGYRLYSYNKYHITLGMSLTFYTYGLEYNIYKPLDMSLYFGGGYKLDNPDFFPVIGMTIFKIKF